MLLVSILLFLLSLNPWQWSLEVGRITISRQHMR